MPCSPPPMREPETERDCDDKEHAGGDDARLRVARCARVVHADPDERHRHDGEDPDRRLVTFLPRHDARKVRTSCRGILGIVWILGRAAMLIAIVGGTTGCVDSGTPCRLVRTCGQCTMEACAWCFETGMCQDTMVVCPGERALAPEQCEAARVENEPSTDDERFIEDEVTRSCSSPSPP